MGTSTIDPRAVSLEYVSLDVVRGILSELDDVDDRLGKLDDLLVARREEGDDDE